MRPDQLRFFFLLALLTLVTAGFLVMIHQFLLTILLAAAVAALVRPAYVRIVDATGGHRYLGSALTLVFLLVLVLGPLTAVLIVAAREAAAIGDLPFWNEVGEPGWLDAALRQIPGSSLLLPYRDDVLSAMRDAAGAAGSFVLQSISATTRSTLTFFLNLGLFLYALFFFLIDGPGMLRSVFTTLPLRPSERERLLERVTSVTRATLRGTVVIGLVQGTLTGLGLWIVGLPSPFLLGTIAGVLSVVPAIGPAMVWIPGSIVLALQGEWWQTIVLVAYGSLVVASVDNVLRPRLVGGETEMHDVLVLVSTLGGLAMFGVIGFIVGPVIAALLLAVWQIVDSASHTAIVEDARTARDDVTLYAPASEPAAPEKV